MRRSSRPPPSARAPGDVVAERFQVEREAGSGGMGTVYRALDLSSGQTVALKLLSSGVDYQRDRFERGARLLAHLDHPAIVRYVAHGVTRANEPYLAMQWLDGEDLNQRLARAPLSLDESLAVALRVARGLAHAHHGEVVHRDVKPSNVMLPAGSLSEAVVLDFGLARLEHRVLAFTRTGVLLGTPRYMAPEQARGSRDIDARADVYALGCVLFECVTGRPAFAADDVMALLDKIRRHAPPRLSQLTHVPAELDGLVARMLAKQPEIRPPHGDAVVAELEAIIAAGGGQRDATPAAWRQRDPAYAQTLDEPRQGWDDAAHERTERATRP